MLYIVCAIMLHKYKLNMQHTYKFTEAAQRLGWNMLEH
jgi:hypothetical protein